MEEEIIGLNRLQKKLIKIYDLDVNSALTDVCLIVETAAKNNCPVDTGTLRRSITHEVEDNVGYVGTNEEYAPYVEYGTGLFALEGNGRKTPWSYQTADGEWHTTVGQHPKQFLHNAVADNREIINERFREELAKQIREVVDD